MTNSASQAFDAELGACCGLLAYVARNRNRRVQDVDDVLMALLQPEIVVILRAPGIVMFADVASGRTLDERYVRDRGFEEVTGVVQLEAGELLITITDDEPSYVRFVSYQPGAAEFVEGPKVPHRFQYAFFSYDLFASGENVVLGDAEEHRILTMNPQSLTVAESLC